MSDAPLIKQLELGPMQNFVYLIGDPQTRDCVVVDPAWEIDAIADEAAADGYTIRGILVTHTHQDHVGGHLFGHDIPGVAELLGKAPAKVYVHKAEREFLRGMGTDVVKVDGGDSIPVGRFPLTFIHTRSHAGPQCFRRRPPRVGRHAVHRSCGRTDLPGSDPKEMYTSLTQRLGALPDETVVLPGHNYGGSHTTIGDEKRQNPMMRFSTMTDFLRAMGGGRAG
jgi:glyoxylase-like metal-dependent hydrolase (beta-lactamase superfamily II)